ncbi:MAG: FadR/GntR family transcriptional regulator [Planctomycetota bacterium]
MKIVPRTKMRDQVAQQIKEYILAHRLGPGDRLPTESQLAESFGISRLSVREATKALEFLGIVESKTGVGLTVGRIDMDRMVEHLGFHTGLMDADPEQLIATRVIIETGVLPYVAQRMKSDPTIEVGLRERIDRFRATRELQTWIALDIEFHRSLLEASGLQPIVAFGDLLHVFFRRFRDSVKQGGWKQGIESHARLVDYLAAGNVAKATTELRSHIESHKERMQGRRRTP